MVSGPFVVEIFAPKIHNRSGLYDPSLLIVIFKGMVPLKKEALMESIKTRRLKHKKILKKEALTDSYRVQDESPEDYEKHFKAQVSKSYFRG